MVSTIYFYVENKKYLLTNFMKNGKIYVEIYLLIRNTLFDVMCSSIHDTIN